MRRHAFISFDADSFHAAFAAFAGIVSYRGYAFHLPDISRYADLFAASLRLFRHH